jgi:CRP-like cAMP-binding protein
MVEAYAALQQSGRAQMHTLDDPKRNGLLAALAALPGEAWSRWLPQLEPVDLPQGRVIHEAGSVPSHLYFPCSAIVSLVSELASGASAGIGVVGSEGVVGISLFMGGDSMPSRAVVQRSGGGYRVVARFIQAEFRLHGAAMHLLLRYTQALLTQMSQTAACNRHHTIDQQLSRWLLRSVDRSDSEELVMTHELIASMLGVRREGVTEAALRLQAAGVIRYGRGHISVLDRRGLEQRTCECYGVVKREYERLLPALTVA